MGSGQAASAEVPSCAGSGTEPCLGFNLLPILSNGADGVFSAVVLLQDLGLFPHTGIFAYLNYHVPRTRREILETLIKGLQRLEYRGYDSAGTALGATVALV